MHVVSSPRARAQALSSLRVTDGARTPTYFRARTRQRYPSDRDRSGPSLQANTPPNDSQGYRGVSVKLVSNILGPAISCPEFLAFCRNFSSGGTRIRTGDTMIFSHIPRPLGMRKTRIGKRISVHGVPLDTSWFCSYGCATVDTAFVTRALAQPLGVLRRGHKQRSRVVCADAGQGHQVGCYPATSQLSWTSNSSASVR